MTKTGLSQGMQAGITMAIDELRSKIEEIKAQIQLKQVIYDELVIEFKEKLEQRLLEVKEKVKVKPFADLQAANQVTDMRMKALDEKLAVIQKEKDDAELANEDLNSKVEELQQKLEKTTESHSETQSKLASVESQLKKTQESQIETQN
jgi:chromosome segregation ATPase